MNIILLGSPGSGKGTQAELICDRYHLNHISTGDLLRKAIYDNTPLGKKVKNLMSSYVPDKIVMDLIRNKLKANPNGCVLDGFPRTLSQAKQLEKVMKADYILFLNLDIEESKKRIMNRRTCTECSAIYATEELSSSVCPLCGGKIVVREEDKNLDKRIKTYQEKTLPVIEYYKDKGLKVIEVNDFIDLPINEGKKSTFNEIKKIIEG